MMQEESYTLLDYFMQGHAVKKVALSRALAVMVLGLNYVFATTLHTHDLCA